MLRNAARARRTTQPGANVHGDMHERLRRLAIAATGLALAGVSAASAAQQNVRGPWLLTALPGMGTITWRCDPARNVRGLPALGLVLRTSSAMATETVELRVGAKRVVRRVTHPGERFELPYLRSPRQQLSIVQATEPGTLKAVVSVDFSPRPISPSHCFAHLPPALVVPALAGLECARAAHWLDRAAG
jgi:hypothetical protein